MAEALALAGRALSGATDSPRLDAEVLLAHVLGVARSALIAESRSQLSAAHRSAFEALVARRAAGEPAAYLTGVKEFWSLPLRVTPDVLIPRPETELLVEWALEILSPPPLAGVVPSVPPPLAGGGKGEGASRQKKNFSIADLGTGSGAIALAIAHERPDAQVVATDASAAALRIAQDNARNLGIENVRFAHGDWYRPLAHQAFDLIVSNPPYVAASDPHLLELCHEPPAALIAGADGLEALRALIAGACAHLAPGGWLVVEHGAGQGAAVRELFQQAGFEDVQTHRDLAGLERASAGRQPASPVP